jgi:serine/threonine-protein kinase
MPDKIGHYTILSELGRGGMGIVYKAREESLDRFVAIKVLTEKLTEDNTYLQRFVREARAAAGISHPNIVQIFFVGEEGGKPYFVMEYVTGRSLSQILRDEGKIGNPRAAQMILQAAHGLAAAHDKGIIHRDIKPANLILDDRGMVKIADFGLAMPVAQETRLTATGMLVGTPGYLAPEQCMGEKVDNRTDIYALGVTFYELLAGAPPFRGESPLALLRQILDEQPPDLATLNPDVDAETRAMVAKMIAKDRAQRYQDCHAIVSDLEDYLAKHGVRSMTAGLAVRPAAPAAKNLETVVIPQTLPDIPMKAPQTQPSAMPVVAAAAVAAPVGASVPVAASAPMPVSVIVPIGPSVPVAASAPMPVAAQAPDPLVDTIPPAPPPTPGLSGGALLAIALVLLLLLGGGATAAFFVVKTFRAKKAALTAAINPPPATTTHREPVPAAEGVLLAQSVTPPLPSSPQPAATQQQTTQPAPITSSAAFQSRPARMTASAAFQPQPPVVPPAVDHRTALSGQPAQPRPQTSQAQLQPRAQAPSQAQLQPRPQVSQAPLQPQPARAARARSGVVVAATGDRGLVGAVASVLMSEVGSAGLEATDAHTLPSTEDLLRGGDVSTGRLLDRLRDEPNAVLLLARVEPTGERQLTYMGRYETAYTARVTVTAYDLATGRPTGASRSATIEYTSRTADREAEKVAGPLVAAVLEGVKR